MWYCVNCGEECDGPASVCDQVVVVVLCEDCQQLDIDE